MFSNTVFCTKLMLYLKIHKIHNLYNNLARRRNAIILRCTAVYFVVSHGGNVFSARIVQKKLQSLLQKVKGQEIVESIHPAPSSILHYSRPRSLTYTNRVAFA